MSLTVNVGLGSNHLTPFSHANPSLISYAKVYTRSERSLKEKVATISISTSPSLQHRRILFNSQIVIRRKASQISLGFPLFMCVISTSSFPTYTFSHPGCRNRHHLRMARLITRYEQSHRLIHLLPASNHATAWVDGAVIAGTKGVVLDHLDWAGEAGEGSAEDGVREASVADIGPPHVVDSGVDGSSGGR